MRLDALVLVCAVPTLAPLPAQEPGSQRPFAPGRYEGTALNVTANQKGKVRLEISDLDPSSRKVDAYYLATDGLVGEGWLTGTVSSDGTMTLTGKLSDWTMSVYARSAAAGAIEAAYKLVGPTNQEGRFTVNPRGPASPVLAHGDPPLTQWMVNKFIAVYSFLLDLKLSAAQKAELQSVLIDRWSKNDRVVMERVISDLKATGQKTKDELKTSLGADYQQSLLEGIRRGVPQNPVLVAFVEFFDQQHADRKQATRASGFQDLIGTWRWEDHLLAGRNPFTKRPTGISYTDSRTLEIGSDGQFKHMQVHNHCSAGACCRMDAVSEYGTVSVEQGMLVFQITSGTKASTDSCNSGAALQSAIPPRKDSSRWSIRVNPLHNNAPTLCWTSNDDASNCYVKQQ